MEYKFTSSNYFKDSQMSHIDEPETIDQKRKARKSPDAVEKKKQRITRRMKKIIDGSMPFSQREDEEKCAICLSQCGKQSATLPCGHVFCLACIGNWWVTNTTCPYCRQHFQFVFDYKGRKVSKSEIPLSLLMKRQETLKCESCWADIGSQPMRICYDCRCVYMHRRCMTGQQLKIMRWRCEQCLQIIEKEQLDKMKEKLEKNQAAYRPSIRLDTIELNNRHSQRLMASQLVDKWK